MQDFSNGIYRIKNYFSHHERLKKIVLDEIDYLNFSTFQNNPFNKNDFNSYDFYIKPIDKNNKILYDVIYDLNDQMLKTLNNITKEKYVSQFDSTSYCGEITCYKPGNFFFDHNDLLYSDEKNKMTYSCVYYINQNFDGGDLFFPELNIRIKPIENSLVLLPSHLTHRGEEINSGIKLISTTFFRKIKNEN